MSAINISVTPGNNPVSPGELIEFIVYLEESSLFTEGGGLEMRVCFSLNIENNKQKLKISAEAETFYPTEKLLN